MTKKEKAVVDAIRNCYGDDAMFAVLVVTLTDNTVVLDAVSSMKEELLNEFIDEYVKQRNDGQERLN